jgi:hypothetical protein
MVGIKLLPQRSDSKPIEPLAASTAEELSTSVGPAEDSAEHRDGVVGPRAGTTPSFDMRAYHGSDGRPLYASESPLVPWMVS